MEHAESQMIAGVMRVADRTARGLMTPRHEVATLDVSTDKFCDRYVILDGRGCRSGTGMSTTSSAF
jgi:Mg2+/Co2+ transporter CorC